MPSYTQGWFQLDLEDLAESYKHQKEYTKLEFTFDEWLKAQVESGHITVNPVEWVITKDLLAEKYDSEDEDTSVVGTSKAGIPLDVYNKMMAAGSKLGWAFRLKDDDSEHYYNGRVYDPTGEYDSEYVYEILQWASRHSGCTQLVFPRKPEWDMS